MSATVADGKETHFGLRAAALDLIQVFLLFGFFRSYRCPGMSAESGHSGNRLRHFLLILRGDLEADRRRDRVDHQTDI
jgi:hypothetical protein